MRNLCSLLLLGLLGGCAGLPVIDQPTMIASLRTDGSASVYARAAIDSRDRKPAWVRLYVVPSEHADAAQAEIAADAGRLGRWALFPLVSSSIEGPEKAVVRIALPASAVHAGDLIVLAIDPISPGRFSASNLSMAPAAHRQEQR